MISSVKRRLSTALIDRKAEHWGLPTAMHVAMGALSCMLIEAVVQIHALHPHTLSRFSSGLAIDPPVPLSH